MKRKRRHGQRAKRRRDVPSIDSKTFTHLASLTDTRHELALAVHLHAAGLLPNPDEQLQYKFDESRNWRADFAWPDSKVLLESDGGVHKIHGRFISDIEKSNEAQLAGWCLLRAHTSDDPGAVVLLVERALRRGL